ncbi:unnamed protein product [Cutaneotrichosporon oleaginosum]
MTSSTIPSFTLGRVLKLGSLAGLTYAAFETARLNYRYPLHVGSSAPPSSAALWPAGLGAIYEIRALTRIPRGADPRETLLNAFYDTWTLRVEAFIYRKFGAEWVIEPPPASASSLAQPQRAPVKLEPPDREFASRPPAAPYTPPPTPASPGTTTPTPETLPTGYASGLFPVLGRTAESTMVFWGSINNTGGAQLLTCTRVPNSRSDEVQISFGCAETPFLKEGTVIGWVGTTFHRMYMRFLVDRAARRMEKWAGTADSRQ